MGILITWSLKGENISLYSIIASSVRQIYHNGAVNSNAPLWFLLSLYIVRILYNMMANVGNRNFLIISVVFMGCVSFALDTFCTHYHIMWGNVCLGYFFFGAGHLLHKYQSSKGLITVSSIVFVICHLFCFSNIDFRINHCTYGYYWGYIFIALSGIILIVNIFQNSYILSLVFKQLGYDSMFYYVTHWIIIHLILYFFEYMPLQIDANLKTLVVIITMAAVLPIVVFLAKKCTIFNFLRS